MEMQFERFIAEEIEKEKGLYIPVKAGMMERMTVKSAPCTSLHPNPDDEFCFPEVGPSYRIISQYVDAINQNQRKGLPIFDEPVIVEKVRPDGYMLLNGHHRWAAALKLGIKSIPIKIVNLPLESDIKKMLENAKHDRRVTLDLDEVVFREPEDPEVEVLPKASLAKKYPKRLRLGIPALFHFLTKNGYDIWVYSANYYSIDDIKDYFKQYAVNVDGIITGTAKKKASSSKAEKNMEKLVANHYPETIHIDNDLVLETNGRGTEYREFQIDTESGWSKEVIRIVGELKKEEEE